MTAAAPIAAASYAFNGDSAGCYSAMTLVNALAQKSIRLSPRSRLLQTNGKIVSSASVDSAFVNFACPMSAEVLVQPVTILAGCGLLIYTLGTSALVGVAVLVLSSPAMLIMLNRLKDARKAQLFMIDKRVRLLNEILNSVRGIKLYAYERYFAERVLGIREGELGRLKTNIFHRASMIATMAFLPILATILTFITYGLTGHTLDAPTILSAFQVFGVIQAPLQQLPMALAAVSDGFVALGRISAILLSEEVPERIHCDRCLDLAVDIEGGFTYETPVKESTRDDSSVTVKEGGEQFLTKAKHAISKRLNRGSKADTSKDEEKNTYSDDPFRLQEIKLQIPRGAFVAIVGRIGSGKSALLQGIIGSMRQAHGYSHFGGSLSYVAQQSWIQNATLRQNIAFNQEEVDEVRLRRAIAACSLSRDIELLPDGLETEIGGKSVLSRYPFAAMFNVLAVHQNTV
jgi:ATP-binding cassette subfamily C (CFTR/MRP) protein 1